MTVYYCKEWYLDRVSSNRQMLSSSPTLACIDCTGLCSRQRCIGLYQLLFLGWSAVCPYQLYGWST